jgi:hypothetical protein
MHHAGYMAALHLTLLKRNGALNHVRFRAATNPTWFVARPVRLERTTCGFEVRRSIQLSYGRLGVSEGTRTLDHWGHNPVLYPTELHSPSFLNSSWHPKLSKTQGCRTSSMT